MDHIQNGGKEDKIMKSFLHVLLIVSLLGCIFLSKWNINFSDNGFVDNSSFLSLFGERYSFDEIEKVYYQPNRVNALGETLEYPSYVIKLKNGKEIDLYEFAEFTDYDPELLDFLQSRDVKIERLDC